VVPASGESAIAPDDGLAVVVLAAGAGRRYGGAKQLAQVGAESLVGRAARLAQALCPGRVVVVTGAHAEAVEAALAAAWASATAGAAVIVARNHGWQSGLGSSIGCGLAALPAGVRACLLMLADQAALTLDDLKRLRAAWRQQTAAPAAAWYGGRPGAPAIFPATDWPALRALDGDRGAAVLLAQRPGLVTVPMPAAAIDIDLPADLDRLPR
jgi:molybdenum cofactor cytidylyltransferase